MKPRHGLMVAVAFLAAQMACTAWVQQPPLQVAIWLRGPIGWILTGDEVAEARRLRSRESLALFEEAVWERRDPDPAAVENPRRELFERRVREADQLYSEPTRRGAATPRGRAHVLLGSPTLLRSEYEDLAELSSGVAGGTRARRDAPQLTRVLETWVYPPQDLPAPLLEALREEGEAELYLVFELREDGCRWRAGEDYLEVAREAWAPVGGASE